jgi:hypothetical protein
MNEKAPSRSSGAEANQKAETKPRRQNPWEPLKVETENQISLTQKYKTVI